MEFVNHTPFEASLAIGLGPEKKPCVSVVVKATYTIPTEAGAQPQVADEQIPFFKGDEYHDGDVTGSLLYETDDIAFKPKADVVVVGHAYTPGLRPMNQLDVMLRVGRLQKAVRVFGDRHWLFPSKMVMVPIISDPKPFHTLPLRYEYAFGGTDRKAHKWFPKNMIGKGFVGKKAPESMDGKPLPNIENPYQLIAAWDDEPDPAGFGFYSRTWQPRVGLGGSVQGNENPHPFFGLASDFQVSFFNGAPPDLQVPGYLVGNEAVEMMNFTPDGPRRFQLPGVRPSLVLRTLETSVLEVPAEEQPPPQEHRPPAQLDTLVLLPDEARFYLVWRGVYPIGEVPDEEALSQVFAKMHSIEIQLDNV